MEPISPQTPFKFTCHSKVSCFNECCRDLNQFLTPYDIIRLKQRLRMTSTEFLKAYTSYHPGPQSGFPIVTLRMVPDDALKCPFVESRGCGVYEDRPASCRTYPLIRMASRSRETGDISEAFYLIREDHCHGFNGDLAPSQTAEQWIETQQIDIYNKMNDMLLEPISLKNRLLPVPFDEKTRHAVFTALYDLDRFRQKIASGEVSIPSIDVDRLDDVDLLEVGIERVKQLILAAAKKKGCSD